MDQFSYAVTIYPLSAQDGGGFAAVVPDLPGCVSDGESPEEALVNARGAIVEWLATAREQGMAIPTPTARKAYA